MGGTAPAKNGPKFKLYFLLQKHQYIGIDGRTSPTIRQTMCDQFQHDEQYVTAVLSITTANVGKWVGLHDHMIL